jgi:ribose transport system permease protein
MIGKSGTRTAVARLLAGREMVIFGILVVEFLFFAVASENFATVENLRTVLRNSTELALVAAGLTLIVIQGGIDVSVGSVLGVVAFVVGSALLAGVPVALVLVIALATGSALGLLNGAFVTFGRIPPIITTLGTMNVWRAAIFFLLGGQFMTGIPSFSPALERGTLLGLPLSFLLVLSIYAALWYVMRYRIVGRTIYAIGNNEEAAHLAGLNVRRAKLLSYAMLGALTGLAGLTYTMRLHAVEITVGIDIFLLALAAVVIGGTSVTGGSGSVVGTLMGVLFVGFLRNGLVLLGIPSLWERAALGFFIIASVGIDLIVNRRRSARRALAESEVAG